MGVVYFAAWVASNDVVLRPPHVSAAFPTTLCDQSVSVYVLALAQLCALTTSQPLVCRTSCLGAS
jgi:hypothetical protein